MRLTEITYPDAPPIDGYGPGFFRVGGEVYRGAVLVSPDGVSAWGGFEDTAMLAALAERVDVVFIGMGDEVGHPPRAFRDTLEEADVATEAMASGSAARTYNVLLSEGRRVAAALLPVSV